jgi:flagellar hook-basal body complex protein FliE
MRIKLVYSIEEENINNELAELLKRQTTYLLDATKKVHESANKLSATIEPLNLNDVVQEVENAREMLLDVDIRLQEVIMMMNGYSEYKSDLLKNEVDVSD